MTGIVSRYLTIYFIDLPRFFYFQLSKIIRGYPAYSHYYILLVIIVYYYIITIPIYYAIRLKKTGYLWLQKGIFLLHLFLSISIWY